MPRVLLLLPSATYRAPDFIDAARRLDVDVVVGSDRRQALAPVMGDRALTVPLRHPHKAAEAIVAHHEQAPLDAIVAVDDQGVVPAALAAERIGLPHNPPAAVMATRDKAIMRAALGAAGVAQPEHRTVLPGDDVAAVAEQVGLPCVVKPLALSASRGVMRADTPAQAVDAARRVRTILECADEEPDGPLLVEHYVPGVEVAVEGLLRGGEFEVLAVFDKPDPMEGPYFEETLLVTPSRLPQQLQGSVGHAAAAAATALGLREGPVHAELRVPDGQPVVLELAARSIGGLCARTLRFGLGTTLEELILRHALDLPLVALEREEAAAGVLMLPVLQAGTLREVRGQERARAVAGVEDVQITVAPGRPVTPLPEGDRYLGFVFARGQNPAQVETALREAWDRLEVVVSPSGP